MISEGEGDGSMAASASSHGGVVDESPLASLSSLLGEGYELVSRTHHVVHRSSGGSLYLKTTRHRDPISHAHLARERVAGELLGREVAWGYLSDEQYPHHPYLLSTSMGRPIKEWSANNIALAVGHMNSTPVLPDSAPGLPEADEWPRMVLQAIKNRGSSVDITPALEADYSPILGDRLVHRDPHLGNWVVGEEGELALIDWEAGMRGSLDVMRALIAYNVVLLGGKKEARKAVKPLLRGVESAEGVRAALQLKGLSAASWAEWSGLGRSAMEARIKAARDTISLL